MESMCLRLELIQRTVTVSCRSFMAKANAGSVKASQPLLSSERSPCTHLRNLLRSGRGFGIRAGAAAGFPVSYESGGPDIGDGDGHGGHGGNNGGGDSNNNNNNNSDGCGDSGHSDNKLVNTISWLILQCLRMLRAAFTVCVNGRPDLVWLAMVERAFEFVSVDLMMSAGLTSSLIAPAVLVATEATMILLCGLTGVFAGIGHAMCVLMSMMLMGFVAVTAGLSWALLSLRSNSDIFQNSRDGNDDENDYTVE